MKGAPVSKQFDDVYFSADNGLEETHHVFIESNDLPAAWQGGGRGAKRFVIGETGFGTGLNFLAVWKLFEEQAPEDMQLHFVSFERYPLSVEAIREALQPFSDRLDDYIEPYLARYPMLVPGFHRIAVSDRVFLTLIFDDINQAMPELDARVDCWFLDGFTPAKNPEMWTQTVFDNMARLSVPGASFATFTAAGDVKRGLREAGFEVRKKDGFGRKRDMLAGRYPGSYSIQCVSKPRVAIIGGGLAGTACAYTLKRYGLSPVIYESGQALAGGASGNKYGLYNPRFSAFRTAESDFYAGAFAQVVREFAGMESISQQPCSALHLVTSEDKEKRFRQVCEHWGWPEDELRMVRAAQASEIAGIKLQQNALYLKSSGAVSPAELCVSYANNIEVRKADRVEELNHIDADILILACGAGAKPFVPWLPIHSVRGQVSEISGNDASDALRCNLHFGGYISAAHAGRHMVGATFQSWLDHCDILDEDNAENIARMQAAIPAFAEHEFPVVGARAALRTSSKDRFPIAGAVPGMPGVYVSTAHGSHGIVSSLACAQLIADDICGAPVSQSKASRAALSAQRFIDRAAKKGEVLEGLPPDLQG